MSFSLPIKNISDEQTRLCMEILRDLLDQKVILSGEWRLVELTFTGAVTNYKYAHRLGFVPKDVIQTSKTGAGAITWNYDSFDGTNLDITTTGACVVRALVGRQL